MLPACEILDSIGYYSLECWGGATFDACLRFLDEDPWERLRQLRAHLPHTKLQMLFRGQNILGYKHYADDVVDEFCAKSIENGIDIIRIFDALNDVRNLEQAIKSTKKYGGQVEATLSYTISPIHNEDYFVKLARELEQMGADVLCIKDMANLLLPMDAYSLVKRLKETVNMPIHLHTHNTSGTGDMVYLMAAMAGVDIVDTALSPLANGTSQPATESLVATLKGTVRDTGLDLDKMSEAAIHFRKVACLLYTFGFNSPDFSHIKTVSNNMFETVFVIAPRFCCHRCALGSSFFTYFSHTCRRSRSSICRSTLAGTPAAILLGGMSRVTTAPAVMMLPAPMVTPPHTVAPAHSQQ